MALWRIEVGGVARWAAGAAGDGPERLLPDGTRLDDLLGGEQGALGRAARTADGDPVPTGAQILAPLESQPVWAAGVTFERSREARGEESRGNDVYDRVYDAERPELFLKALPGRARGPGMHIGIRSDSSWDVPEPELALVVDARGEVVAYSIGNDVSSRSIEGANPLYLPQAKVYPGSCAVGPCLVPVEEAPAPSEMVIELRIERRGRTVVADSVSVASMHRTLEELVQWLMRCDDFGDGVVLLTGTSIVPGAGFTLREGDTVAISITGIGTLRNPVATVGSRPAPRTELAMADASRG